MNKIDILQLLQIYRTNLNQKLNYPGWTIWALIATLSTMLWIFIENLYSTDIKLSLSINIAILLYFMFSIINGFLNVSMTEKKWKNNDPTYYFTKIDLTGLNPKLIFQVIIVFIIYYYINCENLLEGLHKIIFNIYFYAIILSSAVHLIFSSFSFNLPKNSKFGRRRILNLFTKILVLLGLMIISYGLFINIGDLKLISLSTIKLGLLLFGLYFVIKTLLGIRQYVPLLKEFDVIIDDVTFDVISSQEALNKLNLLINGLSFKDIIYPQLSELLQLQSEFDRVCDKIDNSLTLIKKIDLNNDNKDAVIDMLADSIKLNQDSAMQLMKQIEKKNVRIVFKLGLLSPDQKYTNDYNMVLSQMKDATKNNKTKLLNIKTNLVDVGNLIKQLDKIIDDEEKSHRIKQ